MRPPSPITAEQLRQAANRYLNRYAPTVRRFRRVMMRRVRKAGGDIETGEALLDAEVQRRIENGDLDDGRYARNWVEHLHRRGLSAPAIRNKLAGKGLPREEISAAFEAVLGSLPDPAMQSAIAYAKRRRLGPFRAPEKREERRKKDLAAMVRAGHGYQNSRRVISGEATEIEDGG
jgi:regulatory protein